MNPPDRCKALGSPLVFFFRNMAVEVRKIIRGSVQLSHATRVHQVSRQIEIVDRALEILPRLVIFFVDQIIPDHPLIMATRLA